MLGLVRRYVLKFIEDTVDVVVYGDVDRAFDVVPFQVESAVKGARPVDCSFVVGIDCVDKVILVVLGKVLNSKVVDAKGKSCFSGVVFSEAWYVLHWMISKGYDFLDELFE